MQHAESAKGQGETQGAWNRTRFRPTRDVSRWGRRGDSLVKACSSPSNVRSRPRSSPDTAASAVPKFSGGRAPLPVRAAPWLLFGRRIFKRRGGTARRPLHGVDRVSVAPGSPPFPRQPARRASPAPRRGFGVAAPRGQWSRGGIYGRRKWPGRGDSSVPLGQESRRPGAALLLSPRGPDCRGALASGTSLRQDQASAMAGEGYRKTLPAGGKLRGQKPSPRLSLIFHGPRASLAEGYCKAARAAYCSSLNVMVPPAACLVSELLSRWACRLTPCGSLPEAYSA